MSTSSPVELCQAIVSAIQAAQESLGCTRPIYTVLNAHWDLQDRLHRLVQAAHDTPAQTLAAIETHCPNLERDVWELIAANQYPGVTGVQRAREEINKSVTELKRMKEESATPFGLSA